MTFEEAIKILKTKNFPDNANFERFPTNEYHSFGRGRDSKTHLLETYKPAIKEEYGYIQEVPVFYIDKYPVHAKYNVCTACRIITPEDGGIRNKVLTILDKENNKAYQKWFIKGGNKII